MAFAYFLAAASKDFRDTVKSTGAAAFERDGPTQATLSANDVSLLAQLRGEDRAQAHVAFQELFRAHYDAMCDYAERIVRDAAEAEDVAQMVFKRVLERRAQVVIGTSIRGYLLRAVRREALHVLRHARVVAQYANAAASAAQPERSAPSADLDLAASELTQVIELAVAQLPARCQEAFSLRWRYELSYAEVASTMGISVKTVEMQLTRALKVVRAAVTAYLHEGHTG